MGKCCSTIISCSLSPLISLALCSSLSFAARCFSQFSLPQPGLNTMSNLTHWPFHQNSYQKRRDECKCYYSCAQKDKIDVRIAEFARSGQEPNIYNHWVKQIHAKTKFCDGIPARPIQYCDATPRMELTVETQETQNHKSETPERSYKRIEKGKFVHRPTTATTGGVHILPSLAWKISIRTRPSEREACH